MFTREMWYAIMSHHRERFITPYEIPPGQLPPGILPIRKLSLNDSPWATAPRTITPMKFRCMSTIETLSNE